MAEDYTREILRHLETHGVVDKDATGASRRSGRAPGRRSSVDLHGMTAERASAVLKRRVAQCRKNGVRSLLVVHGRGNHSDAQSGPVLPGLVERMLAGELAPHIRDYKKAPPAQGGGGATIVYFR